MRPNQRPMYFILFSIVFFAFNFAEASLCFFQCHRIPKSEEVLSVIGHTIDESMTKKSIRVISWNIFKAQKPEFASNFKKLSAHADLILLSEAVNSIKILPSLLAQENFQWNMATSWFMKKNIATGLMIGAAAKPESLSYLRTKDREPFANTPKMIMSASFSHAPTGKTITVVNVHGINFVNIRAYQRQMKQLNEILSRTEGPVILAGDFNMWKPEREEAVQEVLIKNNLQPVQWENAASGYSTQVDLAFVRDLTVTKARVVNEVVEVGSDHPALEFEVQP